MRSKYSDVNPDMSDGPSEIEQILARLPDADQKIISARFETMVKEIQRQRGDAQKAMNEAEELRKSQSTGNTQLLRWGLKNIEQQLPDEVKSTFNCAPDQLMPELSSSDPEAVLRTDRLICACSHQMMQMSSQQQTLESRSSRKRTRGILALPAELPPAVAASPPRRAAEQRRPASRGNGNTFGPFNS